jgi:uncharacterized membrane protein YdjX (TVP38/TMEM64 family)
MLFQILIQSLMLVIGYTLVSRLIAAELRSWGLFAGVCLYFLQTTVAPWPFGVPLTLCAFIAFGVGCKAGIRPDKPDSTSK